MKDFTDITVVLDRSGSMGSVHQATVDGFDKFVAEQKEFGDNAALTLVQFDDIYDLVWNGLPIKTVPSIKDIFQPRGWTALLDAIGKTINSVGARLAAMPEKDRPNKVIMVVITDGGENASKEFTREKIIEMIRHQETKYCWKFVFLGANQDAIATAQSMGISAGFASSYNSSPSGCYANFSKLSDKMSMMRSCCTGLESCNSLYTKEDEEELLKS